MMQEQLTLLSVHRSCNCRPLGTAYKYGDWMERDIAHYNELTGTLIPAFCKTTEEMEGDLREIYVLDAQERAAGNINIKRFQIRR